MRQLVFPRLGCYLARQIGGQADQLLYYSLTLTADTGAAKTRLEGQSSYLEIFMLFMKKSRTGTGGQGTERSQLTVTCMRSHSKSRRYLGELV